MRSPIKSLIIFIILSTIWFFGINYMMTNTIVVMLMIVSYILVVFFLHRRFLPLTGTLTGHTENLNNIRSSALIVSGFFMFLAIFALLLPEIWNAWVFSKLYWITMILLVFTALTWGQLYHEYVSYIFTGITILSVVYGMQTMYSKIDSNNTNNTTPAKTLSEIDVIMAQQDRMEEYYGTFHCTAGSDTSYLFVPAYSILNVKMPVGTKLSITDGNGKHYLYDGYIVTKPDGSMPRDEDKLQFGVGDMYYKICNPTTINVTYLVRKKNRAEIQETLNQQ